MVTAIVPLSVLEAVRSLDRPTSVVLEELPQSYVPKRLGSSVSVQGQIERYRNLATRGNRVAADEVVQLLRLVGRRNDAGLVFSDAGRRAARHGVRRVSLPVRLFLRALPSKARNRVGFAVARTVSRRVFEVAASRDATGRVSAVGSPPSIEATPEGGACALYGAGVGELLRSLAGFEGELIHNACRSRGDDSCQWRAGSEPSQ